MTDITDRGQDGAHALAGKHQGHSYLRIKKPARLVSDMQRDRGGRLDIDNALVCLSQRGMSRVAGRGM